MKKDLVREISDLKKSIAPIQTVVTSLQSSIETIQSTYMPVTEYVTEGYFSPELLPPNVYEPANTNIQTHVTDSHAPANAQKNSDITKAEVEAKLTGELTSHSHAGGSGDMTKAVYDPAAKNSQLAAVADLHDGAAQDTAIAGKTTLTAVKADTDIADAITKKHADTLDHSNANDLTSEQKTDLTDGGQTTLHSHAGGSGMNLLKKTADQIINGGAGVFVDITGLTFPVVAGVDYAFHFYIAFQSALATVGWKAGVNCPAGTLDFWAQSDIIANGAAGVATHTERHNTVRDDMTLLTATVTQAVDLAVRIEGRYKCAANGTFAARFANELATNTQIVVQRGSWGYWF